ncbi:MAG TPA: TonB-dependent receptor [Verrucomicrobiae bacterium]|nr:TonB-dependent receptor [Verrucomicrobiae bacterium]
MSQFVIRDFAVFGAMLITLGAVVPAAAKNAPAPVAPVEDLTTLELDQLLSMEVTSVTRRATSYGKSPAAIFVLTGEDIRRSGARNIAEALRLVPGLQVQRTNAQAYTVTSRGFSGDKLQVLLDGRSVYTPLTSTTFWNLFDTYLEDISRIEVIRGPGATVWGSNAVNGVINIITKPAADSADTHLYAGAGTEHRAFGGFRSGGRIGQASHGRAYVKAREVDSTQRAGGEENNDGQRMVQTGARIDADIGGWGELSLGGDLYEARDYASTFPAGTVTDTDSAGRNVTLQWNYGWGNGSTTQTNLYYDGYDLLLPTVFEESRDTYDLNVQHNLTALGDHLVSFGFGGRVSSDETGRASGGQDNVLIFEPQNSTTETISAFVQDEWAITDSLWLIGGTKLENNTYTGFELQPGVRLGWKINDDFFTWGSVARAVRTPNRLDNDVAIACSGVDTPVAGCPGADQALKFGNPDIESEDLLAYEVGLRTQFVPSLLGDLALFYNVYSDLRSTEAAQRFANGVEAEGYGGELTLTWDLAANASLQGFYRFLQIDARTNAASADTTTVNTLENGSAEQMAGVRLGWQPWPSLTTNAFVRYVDSLPAQKVPAYTELNLRLAWTATPFLEIALVGENLIDESHPEAGANVRTRAEIPRHAFAEISWRWQ